MLRERDQDAALVLCEAAVETGAGIPDCMTTGRNIVPFIDRTTIAANKSPASRLNSTSGPPRRK